MAKTTKYYIVAADALPEIFVKVAEAKCMMQTGEVSTVGEATRRVGISRSAFYKYKDSILPFQNLMAGRIITFQVLLQDTAGLLSQLLQTFSQNGANILTINPAIPVNGVASLTISAETMDLTVPLEDLLRSLRQTPGVIKAEILAG